jgi:hypothetical protein
MRNPILVVPLFLFLTGCQVIEKRGPVMLMTPIGQIRCERHVLSNCGVSFYECTENKNIAQLCANGMVVSTEVNK